MFPLPSGSASKRRSPQRRVRSGAPPDVRRQADRFARRYLRFGIRSIAEFRAYLCQRNIPESVVQSLIDSYARDGILDDRAYAKLRAAMMAERGYAWPAIREQLVAKGIDSMLADRMISLVAQGQSDATRAHALACQRARGRLADDQLRQQLARWLAGRGFHPDVIEQALSRLPQQNFS